MKMNEVDEIVINIVGKDSAVIEGLGVADTWEIITEAADDEKIDKRNELLKENNMETKRKRRGVLIIDIY